MSKLILSITLIVLVASVAQSCRKETTKADFDYLKFNGTWYTIQVIPNIFERGLKCMQTTDVADTKTKGHFKVQDKGLRESDNSVVTADSTLITPDEKNPGFLQNVAGPGGLIKVPFYILDTDYENYAFTYTCVGNLLSIESAWILSRKRTLDDKTVQQGLDLFAAAKVDIKKFQVANQKDCD